VSCSDKNQNIIRKSNELIEARYKLSIAEQRLILLLASEISPDDENFKSYQIKVTDFAKMFGLDSCKAMYKEVQKAAKELVCKRLDLSKNGEEIYTTWLSYVKYIDGSGVINLEFHGSLKPYFLQLKSHFTQYHLNYVMDFKSQYSMRLYELLKMDAYKVKNGQFDKYFEVSELRLFLGVDKKDYALFAGFRRFAIEPAISEISNKTDLFIHDVKYGKTGRKITNVTFFVGVLSKDQTNLKQANLLTEDIKPEKKTENHPVIDELVNLGFSLEIAKKYKNKHGVKKIERNIAYTLLKKQDGNIKDIPSYLNTAIENDYGGALATENQKKVEAKRQQEKLELEKKTTAEKSTQDKKARFQKAFNDFLLLPDHLQEELKQAFFETADLTVTGKIKEAQRKGIDIFTSPLVLSPFKVFLVEQKGF
jgi:plasmid replication initiation protein